MRTRHVLIAGLVAWVAGAVILWLGAAPLGHDEAQYAIAANDVIVGNPARWFYLSKGMNAVALPGALAGGGERALRFVPLLFGIGCVLAAAHLAWRTVGATAAAWSVCVLAATRALAVQSCDLLSDLPATMFLLLGTTLLVTELVREDGPRWRVVTAAPLFAAAFYLRYGSCVPIAVVGVVVVAAGLRAVMRRPGPMVATAVVFAALLVPHVVAAQGAIGSPLGILLESRAVTQEFVGQGLVGYVTANPFVFYGLITPAVMIVGLLSLRRGADRRAVMLWLVAVLSIIAIGLTTHARARYIFFPITLLVILGISELECRIRALAPRARRIAVALAAVVLVVTWSLLARSLAGSSDHRRRSVATTLAAARAIRLDAAGIHCRVMGAHNTQLEHYTGCWGNLEAELPATITADARIYLVDDRAKHWSAQWRPDLAAMPGRPRPILELPDVTVYVLDPR
ncbi:MAG: glycosyltransferase family 39 protein [Kofleriaceae bacterium]